jgi:hypothetical protein
MAAMEGTTDSPVFLKSRESRESPAGSLILSENPERYRLAGEAR